MDTVIYWWAVHQARAISGEDCLVPDAYVTRLAGVPEEGAFPLSHYLLRWVEETPALACLSTTTKDDRRQITLAAMLRGFRASFDAPARLPADVTLAAASLASRHSASSFTRLHMLQRTSASGPLR